MTPEQSTRPSHSEMQRNIKGKIRIGFIGLSGSKGWALKSHYLCIKNLSQFFEIVAVANTSQRSSIDTIDTLKLDNCQPFGDDYEGLARCPEIDMIVISVKNSDHYKIIMQLLNCKETNPNSCNFKILFVEWALGSKLDEVKEIYDKCKQLNVQSIICLQGRFSPYVLLAKNLIMENRIGSINCIEVSGNAGWYGYQRPENSPDYLFDINSGHNLITSAFAHTIDSIQYITGSYVKNLNSMIFNNIKKQQVIQNTYPENTPVFKTKTVPDHLLFHGTLEKNNVPISMSFKGGNPSKKFTKNLVIDIHGTRGDLKIEGNAGFPEISNLVLYFCGLPSVTKHNSYTQDTHGTEPSSDSLNHNNSEENCEYLQSESYHGDPAFLESQETSQVVEKYHLAKYNPVVGNMMRLYEAIAQHCNNDEILEMQGLNTAGFPTFKDAVILHHLIDLVFQSDETRSTVDTGLH